eukprot:SAG31_NODE_6679_length_1927_cov_1.693107_2_plen_110_part_00
MTKGIILSFVLMLGGAVFAARNDLQFSMKGYAWMMANCFSTSAYVVSMARKSKTMKLSKFGMVFYNNLLSLPILLPCAFAFGEMPAMLQDPQLHDHGFLSMAAFSGAVG